MRSLQMVAALVAVLVVGSSAAHAGNVVRYTDGSLGVVESQKAIAERLDITVTPDALAYGDAWKKAVKTGKPVPVETHTERSAHHFTLTTTTVAEKEVVLKQGTVVVESVPITLSKEESFNSFFFILAGIAVAFMVFGHILLWKRHVGGAIVLIILSAVATAFATIAAIIVTAPFAAIAAALAFLSAPFDTTAIAGEARGLHLFFSAVFYGAMVLAALTVYF